MAQLMAERLRELLDYEPSIGIFRWREPAMYGRIRAGTAAGFANRKDGYVRIKIGRKSYLAHRLAWLHVHGEWPPDQIDHIDLDRANNAISNLRAASNSQNQWNRPKVRLRKRPDLPKGVSTQGRCFRARIWLNGRLRFLGQFQTPEEAHAAYMAAAREYYGEFARAA